MIMICMYTHVVRRLGSQPPDARDVHALFVLPGRVVEELRGDQHEVWVFVCVKLQLLHQLRSLQLHRFTAGLGGPGIKCFGRLGLGF